MNLNSLSITMTTTRVSLIDKHVCQNHEHVCYICSFARKCSSSSRNLIRFTWYITTCVLSVAARSCAASSLHPSTHMLCKNPPTPSLLLLPLQIIRGVFFKWIINHNFILNKAARPPSLLISGNLVHSLNYHIN